MLQDTLPMTQTLCVYCLAIVGASVVGGAVPLWTLLTHKRLQIFLSFAAGTMLGAAFFHMMPESVELGDTETLRWVCAGLLAMFLLERFLSFHQHEPMEAAENLGEASDAVAASATHEQGRARWKSAELSWRMAALGLAVHTLVGGFALASAVAASSGRSAATSWGVFLATLIHKPADALTIVTLMLRAQVARRRAHLINLAFSLLLPVGVAAFFVGRNWLASSSSGPFTATALAFSAGTFLCIALSDLLPELQFHEHDRVALSAALVLGIGLMWVAGFGG
jgi:zinc and cadmium transporter